jgi:Holliday junction resolvase
VVALALRHNQGKKRHNRGKKFEYRLVKRLQDAQLTAYRVPASGRGTGFPGDVVVNTSAPPHISQWVFECKKTADSSIKLPWKAIRATSLQPAPAATGGIQASLLAFTYHRSAIWVIMPAATAQDQQIVPPLKGDNWPLVEGRGADWLTVQREVVENAQYVRLRHRDQPEEYLVIDLEELLQKLPKP